MAAPSPRFRRALDRGDATAALSAAAELQHVGLVEALGGSSGITRTGRLDDVLVQQVQALRPSPSEPRAG
jgi:hypothetical protein